MGNDLVRANHADRSLAPLVSFRRCRCDLLQMLLVLARLGDSNLGFLHGDSSRLPWAPTGLKGVLSLFACLRVLISNCIAAIIFV